MKTSRNLLSFILPFGFLVGFSIVRAQDPAPTAPAATVPGTSATQVSPGDGSATGGKAGGHRLRAMAEKRMETLDAALSLTPDEKAQIKDIWMKGAANLKGATRDERRAAMATMHDQVRAVLTPDQQTKFDAMPGDARLSRSQKSTQE